MTTNFQGSVIFATEEIFNNDPGLEIIFEQQTQDEYINPYNMNRHYVQICHFEDARFYDPDLDEAGWKVPHRKARREYRKWLLLVRRIPGWENFRRPFREIDEEIIDDDGNICIIRKLVPVRNCRNETIHRQILSKNPNRRGRLLPQSRDKGIKVTDENFRPRMFTEKMAKEISQIRNNINLTQVDLARKINVDAQIIRNIELGGLVTFNSEDIMVKELAKVLGIPSIKYQE
jgi:DNA-binding XRE family transcriptional regulator